MMRNKTFAIAFLVCTALIGGAEGTPCRADEVPTISPTAVYTTTDGSEEESTAMSGDAPMVGRFTANPDNVGSYTAHYEWRFTLEGASSPYLIRYEEDTEYTFTKAGTHTIELYATFINGTDTVSYTADYWADAEPLTVTISESKLEFPNAFSPNGDGINDIYRAKEGYQSIVEFHATIYNRWGQKLYEWSNPDEGWDGTHNGRDVAQGVYFCLCNAKGADGVVYTIRKDVNLLRGYSEESSTITE